MRLTLISGTNRPGSMTRKVTGHIQSEFQARLQTSDRIQLVDLCDLPAQTFTPASYAAKPEGFDRFVDAMVQTDALFFVIPEYNGGAPGALKYFIDLLPFPQSLKNKPCGFVGLAAGRFGALRAVEQMEAICQYRNAYLFSERTFIMFVDKSIDESGRPTDEMTRKVLSAQLDHFLDFAKRLN